MALTTAMTAEELDRMEGLSLLIEPTPEDQRELKTTETI
jgi:hypothetical protein